MGRGGGSLIPDVIYQLSWPQETRGGELSPPLSMNQNLTHARNTSNSYLSCSVVRPLIENNMPRWNKLQTENLQIVCEANRSIPTFQQEVMHNWGTEEGIDSLLWGEIDQQRNRTESEMVKRKLT